MWGWSVSPKDRGVGGPTTVLPGQGAHSEACGEQRQGRGLDYAGAWTMTTGQ
jgi:hypothetical protein